MADLRGFWRRARSTGRDLAESAPSRAREAVGETRRTLDAVGEVLDERTDGRFGRAVDKGGQVAAGVADRVTGPAAEARDVFRAEKDAPVRRPDAYRPDPIEPPQPIDRPEPI